MCFFPIPNTNYKNIAYKNGLTEFTCGKCPECLSKRASEWALRCTAQARESRSAVMVTLTYDTYKYDKQGKIIGENDPDTSIRVCKRDCQLFMKRLRENFARIKGVKDIKYLITAEYGKRTGRAHYHALLFNVFFDDLIPYKKTKRGNQIYKSATLTKLWGKGICTVDSINVNGGIARYCTKYCVKDYGIDDTFMLVSQGVGINELLKTFNGISYWLDGRELPIPRAVWQKYIAERYAGSWSRMRFRATPTYKYVNKTVKYRPIRTVKPVSKILALKQPTLVIRLKKYNATDGYEELFTKFQYAEHLKNAKARAIFRYWRDRNRLYKEYRKYWERKIDKEIEKDISQRVALLDEKKYHNYKTAVLSWYLEYRQNGGSCCMLPKRPRFEKEYQRPRKDVIFMYKARHLPLPPRLVRASDRKNETFFVLGNEIVLKNAKTRQFKLEYHQTLLPGVDK